MQIGEPLRTIVVEPLELPVSDPRRDPISQPEAPNRSPNLSQGRCQPADEGSRLHLRDRRLPGLAVGGHRAPIAQW